MFRSFIVPVVILLLFPLPVCAAAPLDTVRANVNNVLDVLRDPALKAESAKEAKKARLRPLYDTMFDQVELSRRTLAINWNKLNAAQRQEFVQLFRQVLEKAYIDKILDYTDEKILFDREIKLAENQSEVVTRVVTASKEIPIAYRVIRRDSDWRIYDVIIENVSLVQNYRTQFSDILVKDPPEKLLEILRKKVKGQ
jgi:phospholipid transport system substrate-binding protein